MIYVIEALSEISKECQPMCLFTSCFVFVLVKIDAFVAPLCAEEEKLQMRRALVTSILDSEQDYVDALDKLLRVSTLLCMDADFYAM